jgi:hypothetical protein
MHSQAPRKKRERVGVVREGGWGFALAPHRTARVSSTPGSRFWITSIKSAVSFWDLASTGCKASSSFCRRWTCKTKKAAHTQKNKQGARRRPGGLQLHIVNEIDSSHTCWVAKSSFSRPTTYRLRAAIT